MKKTCHEQVLPNNLLSLPPPARRYSVVYELTPPLHDRHNCRVLGGPEMLRQMRATVQKMAEMYAEEEGRITHAPPS